MYFKWEYIWLLSLEYFNFLNKLNNISFNLKILVNTQKNYKKKKKKENGMIDFL